MRQLALLLFLLPSLALAQLQTHNTEITRGGALRRTEYQSYAAQTLYVDLTGNDQNACTAAGTSACFTLAGAVAKLPKQIRNATTINIAPGTYTESLVIVSDFRIMYGGSLTFTGAMGLYTPATGTSTGAVTTYTPQTGATSPGLTSVAQTWTADNLRGRFITMTSGGAIGQRRVITANTATGVTLLYGFTVAPLPGDTYQIETPSVEFTNGMFVSNVYSAQSAIYMLLFQQLSITRASGNVFAFSSGNTLSMTDVRLVGGATTSTYGLTVTNLKSAPIFALLTDVYAEGAQTGASFTQSGPIAVLGGLMAFTQGTHALAGVGLALVDSYLVSSGGGIWAETRKTGAQAVAMSRVSKWHAGAPVLSVVKCGGLAGSRGIDLTGGDSASYPIPASDDVGLTTFVGHAGAVMSISNCADGVYAGLPGTLFSWQSGTLAIDNALTAAFRVGQGGKIGLVGATVTVATSGSEITMDGAAYTLAFLTSLTPAVISNQYGSTIWK